MIVHIVLFRPKAALTATDIDTFARAIERARTDIPSVRRFRVGRRILHGAAYERMMREDFTYAAAIEFDDRDGLAAYLAHPAHAELGAWYYRAAEGALAYDYEMVDGGEVRGLLGEIQP